MFHYRSFSPNIGAPTSNNGVQQTSAGLSMFSHGCFTPNICAPTSTSGAGQTSAGPHLPNSGLTVGPASNTSVACIGVILPNTAVSSPSIPIPVFPSSPMGVFQIYLLNFCPGQVAKCYGCARDLKPGGNHWTVSIRSDNRD